MSGVFHALADSQITPSEAKAELGVQYSAVRQTQIHLSMGHKCLNYNVLSLHHSASVAFL